MSIPFNPSVLSSDPAGGTDHMRRLMMNPPAEFIQSAAAQHAIEAGRAPAPFSDGPVIFGTNGQPMMQPPAAPDAPGSWSQPNDPPGWDAPGGGTHYASGMGMGVETPGQHGLDQAWMNEISSQLAAGQPGTDQGQQQQGQSPMRAPNSNDNVNANANPQSDQVAIMTAPATPTDIAQTVASVPLGTSAVTNTDTSPTPTPNTALSPSGSESLSASSSGASASVSDSISTSALPSPSSSDVPSIAEHKPFVKSTAFILIIVLASLALVGIIATALRWAFKWKAKDGNDRYLGGMLSRRRRDVESDDLSDIVRHFGSNGGSSHGHGSDSENGMLEKRSSLLAEEMGNAPYLHSDKHDYSSFGGGGYLQTDEPMEQVDLNEPRAPGLSQRGEEGTGSPPMPCSTQRLEVRNVDPDDERKPIPKGWAADRALANIAGWGRSSAASERSNSLNSDASLPSPFSQKAPSDASHGDDWPRSASQCSSRASSTVDVPQPSNWASNLRPSLFAAVGGKAEEDKFTRPVLPLHAHAQTRSLSRASTSRTTRTRASLSQTFGRASGRSLVVQEEDDGYSVGSSTRGEMRQALLLSDGKSSVGERYKAYARSVRGRESEV